MLSNVSIPGSYRNMRQYSSSVMEFCSYCVLKSISQCPQHKVFEFSQQLLCWAAAPASGFCRSGLFTDIHGFFQFFYLHLVVRVTPST